MRKLLLLLVLLSMSTPASAKVINVEFKFTPFIGDPVKSDEVETVPGKARVFVNNVPIADQEVSRHKEPVMFDEREVGVAVWVPMGSMGSVLRKGRNTIRIEFEPADGKKPYSAQLRWASVTDQTTETGDASHGTSTNQSGEGVDAKQGKGKVVFEREFVADFAADQAWHHYPAIASLGEDEKKQLIELVAQRAKAFQPDFAAVYPLLESNRNLDLAALRKAKCLEKAYAAGVRIVAAPAEKIRFVTTGSAAVVVEAAQQDLYAPADPKAFEKIKGDEAQMCASVALFGAYPPRLVMVRSPAGAWKVAP